MGDDAQNYFTLNVTAEATGWSDFDTSDPSLVETSTSSVLSSVCADSNCVMLGLEHFLLTLVVVLCCLLSRTLENIDLYTALDSTTEYLPLTLETMYVAANPSG